MTHATRMAAGAAVAMLPLRADAPVAAAKLGARRVQSRPVLPETKVLAAQMANYVPQWLTVQPAMEVLTLTRVIPGALRGTCA
jgi:hypothetical protein